MTPKEAADTYVVSFWVNDDADDPSIPVLRVGTNTEAQVHASLAKASSADEARWNFAYWLQNDLAVVGGHGDDDGRTMVDARFHELGLRRDDGDFSPDALEVCRQMTETFVACCVDAARRLHDHDGLVGTFGRDIPVLVHELEYYDAIAEQNLACNPPDLVAPFKQWIDSL